MVVRRCRHHWVLEPANGSDSRGVCKKCGEVKSFKNHVASTAWNARDYADYQLLREGVTSRDINRENAETETRIRRVYMS